MLVTKDLNARIRIGFTERLERWKRKKEIADCAATDYENAIHLVLRRNPREPANSTLKMLRPNVVGGRRPLLESFNTG